MSTTVANQKAITCTGLRLDRGQMGGARRSVLEDAEAVFPAGHLNIITGPTGVGKTTLLLAIAGLLRPTAGEIRFNGQSISRWTGDHLNRWRRKVGIVFQDLALLGDLTTQENVMLPLIPRRMSLAEARRRARNVLDRLDLAVVAPQPAGQLSGGQRQRIALARALVGDPELLLADEPTAHQDDAAANLVMNQLAQCARRGAVVIVAAHDRRVLCAERICRRYMLTRKRLKEMA